MLIKIVASGMVCCMICILMKRIAKEYVIFIQLCFAVFVGALIITECMEFFNELSDWFMILDDVGSLYSILLRGAFMCLACKIAGDICIESGNLLVGDMIEIAGKVVLLILSLPLLKDIIKTAVSFAS